MLLNTIASPSTSAVDSNAAAAAAAAAAASHFTAPSNIPCSPNSPLLLRRPKMAGKGRDS